jgi:carboxymethylenebutenolidase
MAFLDAPLYERMVEVIGSIEGALRTQRIPVRDGTEMIVHIAVPASGTATGGGILIFQEAYGVNDYLREVVVRFAGLGLVAVAPELYHRSGDGRVGSYDDSHEVIAPLTKATTPEGLAADVRATYDWLIGDAKLGVEATRVGAVGFCMGGRTAFLANATVPLAAAISFYGGRIPAWFDLIPKQHAPLLMFWGAKDETIPLAQQREVAAALDAAALVNTQVVFSEAGHAFFRHTRAEMYEPRAAGMAWAASIEFLRQNDVLPRA